MPATYSVDTSALLDGWARLYPPTTFPGLWDQMGQLADAGRLLASEEVVLEVRQQHDTLRQWVDEHAAMLTVPTDQSVVGAVQDILRSHARMVMSGSGRNRADPFVIAVAQLRSAVVVTGEKGGTIARPKIPFVCEALRIPCLDFLGLIQSEGWVFR